MFRSGYCKLRNSVFVVEVSLRHLSYQEATCSSWSFVQKAKIREFAIGLTGGGRSGLVPADTRALVLGREWT